MLIMAAAGTPWYLDTKLWVAIPVVLFLAFIVRQGVVASITKALDDRADKIKAELEEARRLREEAQALLASYHRKQKEAEEQAEDIIKQAQRDAEAMAAKARKDLAERLERRAAQAEAKIANAEAQALAEVKNRATELAVNATEDLIRSNMKTADHSRFVKDGTSQMGKALN